MRNQTKGSRRQAEAASSFDGTRLFGITIVPDDASWLQGALAATTSSAASACRVPS